jgi:hypothetical protein
MRGIVEFFENAFPTPKVKFALGLGVGALGVVGATYALMRLKGIPGKVLDGVQIGAACPHCRYFWTGVGLGVIGTIWATYAILKTKGGDTNAPQA